MKPSEILNSNNPVSKEEMQRYLDGKLSTAEKKKVEEKMVDDEFASEASEGFMENNIAFTEVSSLQAAWDASQSKKSVTQNPNVKSGVNYKYWFFGTLGVTVVALAVIGIMVINKDEVKSSSKNENINAETGKLNENIVAENKIEPVTMTDQEFKEEISEIKDAENIPEKKLITYEKTIASQPTTIETKIPEEIEIAGDPNNVESKKIEEIEVKENKKIAESNVKMLYIKNLKAVDYTDFYTNHIAKKEWLLTGVSADKENGNSVGVVPEQVIKYIPYKDFLIEGLTLFSKNDYKAALGHLLTILQQYPDDLNAAFYSGLCYYNLGKTKQAIAMFDRAIGNSIITFKEESEWYKALSLLEYGKKSEAKELIQKIESENGFYAKAAREKLKGMKP